MKSIFLYIKPKCFLEHIKIIYKKVEHFTTNWNEIKIGVSPSNKKIA